MSYVNGGAYIGMSDENDEDEDEDNSTISTNVA